MLTLDIGFEVLDFEPMIEIVFNDEMLFKGIAKSSYHFVLPARFGLKQNRNTLEIKRYGKDPKLHQNGKRDQAVLIKEIKLNGMTFPHIAMYGKFHTEDNQVLRTDYLGHNGIYTLNFGYPVETWITNYLYQKDM